MKALILMYSVIAVFIMNLTYIARIHPELPCTILFEDEEWKILYCVANRTKKVPDRPYTIKEAVDYAGRLGGPKRAPSDGPPRVKTIWTGLQKLYTLWTTVNYSILWVKFSPWGGENHSFVLSCNHGCF
jgi:hypothetical protein